MKNFSKRGAGALAAIVLMLVSTSARAMDKIPDEYKTNGFAAGCQAYSYSKGFTVFEAIRLTKEAGGKVIELFPGQLISDDDKKPLNHTATTETELDQVKAELAKNHVLAVNYGVVTPGGRDATKRKAEWRKVFEFAKKMDLYGVTSEPAAEDMDEIEKLVKEFDIHFCIHDHPKQANNPNYKFWDPNYVLSLVKDRDPRMGSCADTGHWLSSGVDPIEALKILKGRVMSSHLKDRNQKGMQHHDVAWGKGVGQVKEVLDELKAQGFVGNISIEYESDMDRDKETNAPKSYPAIKESFVFLQHYGQTAQR
ncbi:MAG TPA: sugar phosphate isomerase/epimerase [Tepidisphaeraceae bacterium]|jgi:sugar phosphate isomerase/epimerase